MKDIVYRVLLLQLLLNFLLGASFVAAGEAQNLESWTGDHTRLVWVQDQGNGADTFARTKNLALYGYDSRDGKGERRLVKGNRNYFKPIFTPDGSKVVYSDRRDRKMFLLDWDSGKVTKLGSGVAVAVWRDTEQSFLFKKSTVWVYCFDGLQPENKYGTGQSLYRFPLGKPKKKELVWNKTNMAWSNVQLSRDGELLGGLFPWPHGGIVNQETKEFQRFGRGCWTSVSPDNSKLLWIFDGLHRNVQIHDVKTKENWKVNINKAPGIRGFEVYHPRWSNHARYFVMTGPYEKGEGGNKLKGGGEKVEIYVGRFDERVLSVEDWFKVTTNNRADFYPDLWVAGGGDYNLTLGGSAVNSADTISNWPTATDNLLYVWENMKASNQLPETSPIGFYQSNLTLKGRALFNRNLTLNAAAGWGETGDAGSKFGKAFVDSGAAAIELLLTPSSEQRAIFLSLKGDGGEIHLSQNGGALTVSNSSTSNSKTSVSWKGFFNKNEPAHLVANITDGKIELHKNGKSLGVKKLNLTFSNPDNLHLSVGDIEGGWAGEIGQVALYNEHLNPQQLEAHSVYAFNTLERRQPVKKLIVEARLSETTEIPAPDAIGAYRRALVVNSYDIEKVIEGEYEDEKIVVAEWAVLDRKIVKQYSDDDVVERLELEMFEDHPELEGERQMMDIFEPDLAMYYRLN